MGWFPLDSSWRIWSEHSQPQCLPSGSHDKRPNQVSLWLQVICWITFPSVLRFRKKAKKPKKTQLSAIHCVIWQNPQTCFVYERNLSQSIKENIIFYFLSLNFTLGTHATSDQSRVSLVNTWHILILFFPIAALWNVYQCNLCNLANKKYGLTQVNIFQAIS